MQRPPRLLVSKRTQTSQESNSSTMAQESRKRKAEDAVECPYLDTIQRSFLDFDHEHSCSVSLEGGSHIYGCLVSKHTSQSYVAAISGS